MLSAGPPPGPTQRLALVGLDTLHRGLHRAAASVELMPRVALCPVRFTWPGGRARGRPPWDRSAVGWKAMERGRQLRRQAGTGRVNGRLSSDIRQNVVVRRIPVRHLPSCGYVPP